MIRDYKIAIVLFSLALPSASLAQDFDAGLRAAQSGDFVTALKEWKPLAEQGDADAQYNLGGMYRNGDGVQQDYSEAARWFRLAAEQGDAKSQTFLGKMHYNGTGVLQDYVEAVHWYQSAAVQGNTDAQVNYGQLYAFGHGVEQSNILAHMWFNISSANGSETGAMQRSLVAEEMPAADIAEAQLFAKICLTSGYEICSQAPLELSHSLSMGFQSSDDLFAECRPTAIVGGSAAIGGPFELTDHTGQRVTDVDVIDRPTLMYFGYTYCPDVCPLDTYRNAETVAVLKERGIEVKSVMVTIDPARDTVESMAAFVEHLHEDMIGLTGSTNEIASVIKAYRAYSAKNGEGENYLMDHSTWTYLMVPKHGFLEFFGRYMSPEDMADKVACFVDKVSND